MCRTTVGADVKMKTRLPTNLCKKISLWQGVHVSLCVFVCASALHLIFLFYIYRLFWSLLEIYVLSAHAHNYARLLSNGTRIKPSDTIHKPNQTESTNVKHFAFSYCRTCVICMHVQSQQVLCVFNDWKISQRPQSQSKENLNMTRTNKYRDMR